METEENRTEGRPLKRLRTACIIHCTDQDNHQLISPQGVDSWKTLLKAAQIRKHEPLLELAKDITEEHIPDIKYHRKCCSIFTMKRELEKLVQREMSDTSDKDNPIRRSDRQGPSSSQTYSRVCIFCQKESKYIEGNKTRDYLIQCRELRADGTIRNAATRKNDSRILTLVSRDLVAAEGHYHRSCYRNYTRYLNTAKSVSTEEGTDH